ncbi:DUF4876 domain-containing protein [Niabella sp. 22666]|uniref:DUF4876 domain-containing protein n=1 Tax=Niabella sp. 22666 TaxID=3453954 RepID=UPI003F83E263
MKKQLLFNLLILVLVWGACKKNDANVPGIKPVDFRVSLSFGLDSSKYKLPLQNISVSVKNTATGSIVVTKSGTDGVVNFISLPVGTYDIDATLKMGAAEYYSLTGVTSDDSVTFNASEKNHVIASQSDSVRLQLVTGVIGDWVIKQVYFAGSHRTDGALYRDQFIEIYNNSANVLYADSLYIGQLKGKGTLNNVYQLPNGAYDWSKSVGIPQNIDANNDYVYTRSLLRIPGLGKTYPVQPGQSIIVAQTAMNHKSPFTGLDGSVISVRNPALTVDLSGAEFEAYYAPFASRPLASDIDNPNSANVDVLQFYGTDWIIDNNGRDSYIIFKVDASQKVEEWPSYNEPLLATPSSTATKFKQIPTKYIIDAVEVTENIPQDRLPKKLGATLDAGFTFVPLGAYTSQSIIRKMEKTINGRIKLKDTNNSTEDFTYLDVANPKGFK